MISSFKQMEDLIKRRDFSSTGEIDWLSLINETRDAVQKGTLELVLTSLKAMLGHLDQTAFTIHPKNDVNGIKAGLFFLEGTVYQRKGQTAYASAYFDKAWEADARAGPHPGGPQLRTLIFEFLTKNATQLPWPWESSASRMREHLKGLRYMTAEAVRRAKECRLDTVEIETQLWRKANIYVLSGGHDQGSYAKAEHLERAWGRNDHTQLGNNLLPDINSALLLSEHSRYVRDLGLNAANHFLLAGSSQSVVHLLVAIGLAESILPGDKLEAKTKLVLAAKLMREFGMTPRTEGAAEALNAGKLNYPLGWHFLLWAYQKAGAAAHTKPTAGVASASLLFGRPPPDGNQETTEYAWETANEIWRQASILAAGGEPPAGSPEFRKALCSHIWQQAVAAGVSLPESMRVWWHTTLAVPTKILAPLPASAKQLFTIMHISDLQFGPPATAYKKRITKADVRDASSKTEKVLADLQKDVTANYRKLGISCIDCVVLSGDLADSGKKEQYDQVKSFLVGMCNTLAEFNNAASFPPDSVVLVPGNHDVDWSISRGTTKETKEKLVVAKKGSETRYKDRFRHFRELWREFYGSSFDDASLYRIFRFPDRCVSILVLDSCEMENRQQHFGYVSPNRIQKAHVELNKNPDDFRIAVVHHNLMPVPRWYTMPEVRLDEPNYLRNACELVEAMQEARITLVLHGHVHQEFEPFLAEFPGHVAIWLAGAGRFNRNVTDMAGPSGAPKPPSYNIYELDFSSPLPVLKYNRRIWESTTYGPGGWKTAPLNSVKEWMAVSLFGTGAKYSSQVSGVD